jgi:hypothetical protein
MDMITDFNPAPAVIGRPTLYSRDLALAICVRVGGGVALSKVCDDPAMPGRTTVYRWLRDIEEFRHMYAHAREDRADTIADEILAIADDTTIDTDRARVRIDARKWAAAKLFPKRYSERHVVQGDSEADPVQMVLVEIMGGLNGTGRGLPSESRGADDDHQASLLN